MLDIYEVDFIIELDPGNGRLLSIRANHEASDPAGAVMAALKNHDGVSNISTDSDRLRFNYCGHDLDIKYSDMIGLATKLPYGRRVG